VFTVIEYYTDPNNYNEETDSKCIQKAIDQAVKLGLNQVVIPRPNKRRNDQIWIIDETILLPSGITVVLNNCVLRLADNVFCQMFRNAAAYASEGKELRGEQRDIVIKGIGNAVLDGGNHNGLTEKTSLTNGMPHISQNFIIYFHNVRDFSIQNIKVTNQRHWAIALMFCRFGRISNIDFYCDESVGNRDGIDLRVGCNNIIIENITGVTGDDTIALTALLHDHFESKELVLGKDTDIYNVSIKNVIASPHRHNIIRLLNHQGNKIYNINIDTVIGRVEPADIKPISAVKIGHNHYAPPESFAKLGDTHDITVKNIYSHAASAINIATTVKNLFCKNIHVMGSGETGVSIIKAAVENAVFDTIFYNSKENHGVILNFQEVKGGNITVKNIIADSARHVISLSGGAKVALENISVKNILDKLLVVSTDDGSEVKLK
jgi:hypothetical protein